MKSRNRFLLLAGMTAALFCVEALAQENPATVSEQSLIELLEFIGEFRTDEGLWLDEENAEAVQVLPEQRERGSRGVEPNAEILAQPETTNELSRIEDGK